MFICFYFAPRLPQLAGGYFFEFRGRLYDSGLSYDIYEAVIILFFHFYIRIPHINALIPLHYRKQQLLVAVGEAALYCLL